LVNPQINAVIATVPDWQSQIMQQSPGPFYGVPFLIKDIVLLAKASHATWEAD